MSPRRHHRRPDDVRHCCSSSPPPPTEEESSRRLQVARLIHALWTDGGCDLSGLAPAFLDGSIDLLGAYVSWKHTSLDDVESNEGEEDEFGYSSSTSTTCTTCQQKENVNNTRDKNPPARRQDENAQEKATASTHCFSTTSSRREIEQVHCDDLSYQQFTDMYMRANEPVIIQGLTRDWKASKQWVVVVEAASDDDDDGNDGNKNKLVPNLNYLQEAFGSDIVPVHEQRSRGLFGVVSRPVAREMTVSDYAHWWQQDHHQRQQNQQQRQEEETDSQLDDDDERSRLLYLKDWKFVASHPSYHAYTWPIYFQDDWLNQAMGNAYKFVYLGPAGTSTILHADVLRSYSWSTNVCGRKRWYLIPPQYTYLLHDCFGMTLASHLHADQHCLLENDNGGCMTQQAEFLFPGLQEARRHAICVVQEAGETIFVPSKWYHTVENLEDTISINHNWLNGNNVGYCWEKLKAEVLASHHPILNDGTTKLQSASGVKRRLETNNNTDNSQVADDLELLWHVLTKKANALLASTSTDERRTGLSAIETADLETIGVILPELIQLCKDHAPEVSSRRRDDFKILEMLS
jgi:Cupin-like domain